jgi:hypothetical protein
MNKIWKKNDNLPKNQQAFILITIVKSWCHVTCWCLLPLLNDYHDYVVINVIEKNDSHFCVWFKGQDLL